MCVLRLTNLEVVVLKVEPVDEPGEHVAEHAAVVVRDVDDPQRRGDQRHQKQCEVAIHRDLREVDRRRVPWLRQRLQRPRRLLPEHPQINQLVVIHASIVHKHEYSRKQVVRNYLHL